MRALHLQIEAATAFEVTFHPFLTVLTGLDEAQRARLTDAVAALAMGDLDGVDGVVELHGRLVDLGAVKRAAARAAAARAVLAELEGEIRGACVGPDPALVEELEHVHAEVERAEAAAERMLAWPRTRERLELARAHERHVLDLMGYGSYNEALLDRLAPTLDLDAEARLLAARMAVADAEGALAAVPSFDEHRATGVPMVVDETVVPAEGEDPGVALENLAAWSEAVQVICLSDDAAVIQAAAGLGPGRAAVIRAGRSAVLPTV